MKKVAFILFLLATAGLLQAQTIENIRPVQDGDKINVTYRIGGSTEAQLFKIYFSVSVSGGERFEPKAVIGDVGENIRGGRSYYTIIWDVFEDVDELVDPDFFIGIDLLEDASRSTTQPVTQPQQEVTQPVRQEEPKDETPFEPSFATEDRRADEFERNGFFGYSGNLGLGIPIGLSFGSLNTWGYYVVPARVGIQNFTGYGYSGYLEEYTNLHIMAAAGVTRHIVSGGDFYRLHGYAGLGGHLRIVDLFEEVYYISSYSQLLIETGVINVVGPFELSAGLDFSLGYGVLFTFGAGFAF